jgi:hypothetical protein
MKSTELISLQGKYLDLNDVIKKKFAFILNNKKNFFLKNTKNVRDEIKQKIENIENKINFILNKVNGNTDSLIEEFMKNINILNENDFNKLQKIFFVKLLNDIKFLDDYVNFYTKIFYIHIQNNLKISYFINLFEDFFNYIFLSKGSGYEFDKTIYNIDIYKQNFLVVLKKFIDIKFFTNDIFDYIFNTLISLNDVNSIYYFCKDSNLNEGFKSKLNELKLETERDKILINDLLKVKVNKKNYKIKKQVITPKKESNEIEIENMIEEFLFLNNNEDIIYYLKENNKLIEKFIFKLKKEYNKNNKNNKNNKEKCKIKNLFTDLINKNLINNIPDFC